MVKTDRRGLWTAPALVLVASWPLMAQEEEGAASTVRASETLRSRQTAVAVTVDGSQRVSYRQGTRIVSLARVTDRALIEGKQGYEIVRVEPDRSPRVVAQAARTEGEIPIFVTDTGSLQAPVGGVILVLSESWGPGEVEAFLVEHGLDESVTPVEWRKNGYVVSTVPGTFAVELANRLASLGGVDLAVPNFWTEAVPR